MTEGKQRRVVENEEKREKEHLGQGPIGQLRYSKGVWLFLRAQQEAIRRSGT